MLKLALRFMLAVAMLGAWAPRSAFAHDGEKPSEGSLNETPDKLKDIGIFERLGEKIDLDIPFKNEKGETVTFRQYVKDGKPILLSMAYYSCPSLCNFHLNGLTDAFKQLPKPLGSEFEAVVVSIEPKETSELASQKKANYIKAYGRPEGEAGWHFLVGTEENIRKLADQVGFRYKWDEEQKQYAHASAATVLTPDGTISRYLYGIVFEPKTVRLSMIEASNGKVGTIVDRLVLYCFHFDPKASKYSLAAFNVMRGGGVAIVLILAIFLTPFWLRSRKEQGEI